MKSTITKIEEIKNYGYPLEFGEALEQSFGNYKKIFLLTGAVILLMAILFYALMFGVIIGIMGAGALTDFTEFNAEGSSFLMIIVNTMLGIIMAVIIAPLSAGFLQMAHNAETFQEFSFSTAFMHYKSKYLKEILLATFVVALTTNAFSATLQLIFMESGDYNYQTPNIWVSIIAGLISLLASFLTFLTAPLIIFGDLKAIEAIKASITLVSKRFFVLLFLLLVGIVMAVLGVFACCIGLCFTSPIIFSMQYVIYRTALGIDENDELDEIGFSNEL